MSQRCALSHIHCLEGTEEACAAGSEIKKVIAHPKGMRFCRNASRQKCKRSNQKAIETRRGTSHSFMFHYAFVVAWEPFSGRPLLQTDALCSQTVADLRADPILIHFVHKLMQSVAHGRKNEILPSRTPSAISFIG